ncbi:MAG TPA: ferrochelatase [Pyrinomonadaceae bacterium]|jgi:ferrochelatase
MTTNETKRPAATNEEGRAATDEQQRFATTDEQASSATAAATTAAAIRNPQSAIRNSKVGVALLNFGGPWTLADVKPFLYRLFVNPAVLVGVPAPLRQLLAFTIAQVKGPSSVKAYAGIGGGSPQLRWTEAQARGLRAQLNGQGARVRIELGMRSAEPSIESALRALRDWGADELVLLPLFPHFSTTATGTCFDEARAALRRLGWQPPTREITSWPDQPAYAALLRRTVDEAVAQAEAERGDADETIHILFSAHSLPLKIVRRGDPYQRDVQRTVAAVTAGLAHPWSLCFQSRNGRLPWLEPYLEDEIARLAAGGVRRLVVVPVSFVSDHIETLYELDQLYAAEARARGVTHYYRARTFNDDPEFARVLRALLAEVGL